MKTDRDRPCVVFVADDFGRSSTVNRAVTEAHEKGILKAASIMPGGKQFREAAAAARRMETLSVGLHVTLGDGYAAAPPGAIPGLVDGRGCFEQNAWRAWMRCSAKGLEGQLEQEISAQFETVAAAGIRPTHVDGHHHLHLHPRVFPIVCRQAARFGVQWVRVPREPFSLALGGIMQRPSSLLEWTVFRVLGRRHRAAVREWGLRTADRVLGLAATGYLSERVLRTMFRRDLRGVTEVFMHPDAASAAGIRELDLLLSQSIAEMVRRSGAAVAGYRDLNATAKRDTGTAAAARAANEE